MNDKPTPGANMLTPETIRRDMAAICYRCKQRVAVMKMQTDEPDLNQMALISTLSPKAGLFLMAGGAFFKYEFVFEKHFHGTELCAGSGGIV